MAQPVPFHTSTRDPREALNARVERAPEDHAEAVLAAYDVLQQLHDRGLLDIVRTALAASDDLLEMAADTADAPMTIRAVRNLLFLQSVLGRIDPDWFHELSQAIPKGLALAAAEPDEPVSLWRVLRRSVSKDSIRGLAVAVELLESFGRHLRLLERLAQSTQQTTTK